MEEPPWEMKGRGIPVKGSKPVTAPIFSKNMKNQHHSETSRNIGIKLIIRFQSNP